LASADPVRFVMGGGREREGEGDRFWAD
jgi:hypothetical protein